MKNDLNLTWKNVFNSQMVWPDEYTECRNKAKSIGYKYLAFNGQVFTVDDETMKSPICNESNL